jgi:uncharacterized protein (TIRG00374 family)
MSKQGTKKWLMFGLRWGVAIAGITWVVWRLHFHDFVAVLGPGNQLVDMQVLGEAPELAPEFRVWGSFGGGEPPGEHVVPRDQVWTRRSDRPTVDVHTDPQHVAPAKVIAIRPASVESGKPIAPKLLVQGPRTGRPEVIDPSDVVTRQKYTVPEYPLIEMGLNRMAREADWKFLLAALAIMPISYLLTSHWWWELWGVRSRRDPTFVINMVGAFYNTLFALGTTGGDVVKAYYAARHTIHRTRAVMSVLVDRAVGLLALVMLGGTMASIRYWSSLREGHIDIDCRRVAYGSALLLAVTAVGLLVFYNHTLRRMTGLEWLLRRLPMQGFVQNAVHSMELYGRRPGAMLVALLLCFPVHITTIISATFSGEAFHLKLSPLYYWVIVPVIALVGAIPISPQGAGVMEFFGIKLLTVRHNVNVSQAVALVMAIRLVQMTWNLVAGLFVLRGGYHAPTEAEQHELEAEVDAEHDDDEESSEFRVQSSGQNGEVGRGGLHAGGGSQGLSEAVPTPHRGV